jgi:DNA mismatch repair ATPase MutS
MGRRTLERWILNPLVHADDITQRHAAVGELVALGDGGIADLRKLLKTVSGDTTRLLRRAELGDLSPKKLGALYDGFRAMGQVFGWINAHAELDALKTWLPNSDTRSSIRSWIEEVDRTLDVDRLSAVSRISTTVTEPDELRIFRPGINVEVDEAFQQIDNAKRDLAKTSISLGELLYPTFPKNKVETKAKLTQNTSGAYYSVNNADVELLRWYCDQVRRLSARQKRRNKNQETPPSIRWWNSIAEWKEAMKRGDGERMGERMLSNESEEDEINSDEADDENPNDFQAILHRGRNPNAKREEERVRVLSEAQIALISELRIANTRSKTKTHVNAARSDEAWVVIDNAASNIRDAVDNAFRGFVSDIIGQHHDGLTRATHTLADIDALFSLARAALRYNYHRPEVDRDDDAEASFVEAKGIRHPIVERILENIEYVVNDVTLNENGLVLFGTNNSGKTTLGKATALNVVMAQCGGFVAAQSFRFRPFHNIITRLAGHDDMRTGRGTFAVEMTELRTILSRASPRSLVIGDELAHGTEHPSAIGLVASSIIELSNRRTNFLFATHLHRLASLDCITELENVEFKHFHVDRDPDTDEIIYDRKLRSGSGPATYGIEVAAAQGIPQRVIERAHRIRRGVAGEAAELANNKRSRYNASVIMGKCQIPGCEAQAEETDHIKEQSTANERGVIDERFHKNEAHNLAPLCKKHHQDKTQGRLVIEGWATSTTKGRKLIVRYPVEGTAVMEKRVSKEPTKTTSSSSQSTLFSFW